MPSKITKKNKGGQVTSPVKTKPVKAPEPDSDSSEESSSEEETPMEVTVSKTKAPVKAAKPAKPAPAEDSDSSDDDDSDDSAPAKPAVQKKPAQKESSDEDSSDEDSDEEMPAVKAPSPAKPAAQKPAKKAPAKAVAQKRPPPKEESSDEESSDEEDSDEEKPAQAPAKPAAQKKQATKEESDDSSEESEEESEEEPAPVLTATVSNAKGVKEKKLKKFFKSNGVSVKEIKQADKKTFTVDFESAADTTKAVALSGQEVEGRALTIAAVAPAPAQKKDEDDGEESGEEEEKEVVLESGKRKKEGEKGPDAKKQKVEEENITLFVGQLNIDTADEALKKFFKKNGVAVKAVRKPQQKRFGYVDVDPSDMEKALALSGKDFEGKAIKIEQAKPRKPEQNTTPREGGRQQRDFSADDGRTLFVKGLTESVDETKLQEFFPEASEIRLPQKDGYHKGFAYVVFPDTETTAKVMEEKQGADLEGNALYLDYTGSKSSFKPRERSYGSDRSFGGDGGGDRSKSQGQRGSTNVLFVKNLSFNLDGDGLKEAFPTATTARVARFPDTQKPKGFGFVEFGSPEEAASAYDEMQNTEIEGRQVFLDFASPGGGRGGGRGGFGGGRGGFGGRGGGRGGRGGFDRGGRGGRGRGGFDRGGRGGGRGRGGRGGFGNGGGFGGGEAQNKRKTFDSDSE